MRVSGLLPYLFLTAGTFACATATSPDDQAGSADASGGEAGRVDAGPPVDRPDANVPVTPVDAGGDPPPPADADPGCAATMIDVLQNGDFDLGPGNSWTEASGSDAAYPLVVDSASMPIAPHSGSHGSWLGGYLSSATSTGIDTLTQEMTIPGSATGSLVLAGQVLIGTEELAGVWDTLDVELVDQSGVVVETLGSWSNLDESTDWQSFSFTSTGTYGGQTIAVRFSSAVDDINNTNFFIDTTTLTTTACP